MGIARLFKYKQLIKADTRKIVTTSNLYGYNAANTPRSWAITPPSAHRTY